MGFDLSLTEYMLRRYAAGSTSGSGAFGTMTSGIDGDLNVEEPLVNLGGCKGLRPTLELRLPFEAIEALSIDALEPLRENRPIAGDIARDGVLDASLLFETLPQAAQLITVTRNCTIFRGLARKDFARSRRGQYCFRDILKWWTGGVKSSWL